jgi:ubiquinone biosynthesis protein UbiJ
MFEDLERSVAEAVLSRLLLLVNHVLRAEPQAVERLQGQVGKRVRVQLVEWPFRLPSCFTFEITPAGLFDVVTFESPVIDLSVSIQADRPARLLADSLSGVTPRIDLAGDATLASDVSWLVDNLRWDVEDDLARFIGAGAASRVATVASGAAAGVRSALAALANSGLAPMPSERRARAESPPR